ncbi:MAG: DUF4338 domain-containing protein [Acidobacteria bacterium]|nr:DUF4338 domain-containing protein [Acidobacteriota bacterium]
MAYFSPEMTVRYCGREFSAQEMARIREIIQGNPAYTRRNLSWAVCREFQWLKADGGLKEMSCRVAMLRMQRDGLIQLPPPARPHHGGRYRIARTLFAEPQEEVTGSVEQIAGVRLDLIRSRSESHLWNELIDRYHYLGYTALPGAQLRYLIQSAEQPLGCLGFSASAWKIAPRDEWIGWSADQRKKNLHLIVCNARFLLLPWIRVRNLATKVLAMAARLLPNDWVDRYGYRPVLLETFVEVGRFHGTSYKAANWLCVGLTKGRGRNDVHTQAREPVKSIWVQPLSRHFREVLCGR